MIARLRTHAGLGLALAALTLSLAQLGDFVTDDAAITLRYAKQLADGHGVTWNAGEHPVEGYTNFTHVLLGAAAIELGVPALGTLRVLGQASLALLVILVYALAWRTLESRWLAAAAATWVAIHPAFGYWASSGLETAPYTLLAYAGLWAVQRAGQRSTLWPAPIFFVAALTRFEGAVLCAIALAPFALRALRERSSAALAPHARWLVLFLVAYGAYFAWRFHHFGHLLSNSAYWKLHSGSGTLLLRQLVLQNLLLIALACFADLRRLGDLGIALLAMIVVHVLGYHDLRNAVANLHRFYLPLVPAFALLAASALGRIARLGGGSRPLQLAAAAAFLGVLGYDVANANAGFGAARRLRDALDPRITARARVAALLVARVPAKATVAVDDVGVIGYLIPQRVRDEFGLNDETFVHELRLNGRRHVQRILEERPAAIVLASRSADQLLPRYATGRTFAELALRDKRYAKPEVIRSTRDGYHYFVYVRRDVLSKQHTAKAAPLELAPNAAPATQVDDLFRRLRATR